MPNWFRRLFRGTPGATRTKTPAEEAQPIELPMERYYYLRDAFPIIITNVNTIVASGLQNLLQNKHIYQKVSIDVAPEFSKFQKNIYGDDRDIFETTAEMFAEGAANLTVSDRELFTEEKNGQRTPLLLLLLRSVKLFCAACDGKEAFRPIWWSDVANELRKPAAKERMYGDLSRDFQLFTLVYQCQRCSDAPTAFLVRRAGWQLMLEGRSPFEEVEIPSFIPKQERHFYRDSLVASHGGKVLAALFYLRTFIEQFARRLTGVAGRVTGEELMDGYANTLPAQQRDQMPSLRHWYDRLSEAVHAGREDEQLFEEARAEIERHFDFRRLFRM